MMKSNVLIFVSCLMMWGNSSQGGHIMKRSLADEDPPSEALASINPVRKCCEEEQYFSLLSHECEMASKALSLFTATVQDLLVSRQKLDLSIFPEKIKSCPETNRSPYTDVIQSNMSYKLKHDGAVYDNTFNHRFDTTHYCMEMVGNNIQSLSLVLAHCLADQDLVPKCCPKNRYFDVLLNDCVPYYSDNNTDLPLSAIPHLSEGQVLKYQSDLTCKDLPVRLSMDEFKLKGNSLCVNKINECYRTDIYCVDNMKTKIGKIEPSAFVCPQYFINKCCPKKSSLHRTGCVPAERQSLALIHYLNNYRYQIKGVSEQGAKCSPFTIDGDTRTDINWVIDSNGLAIINKKDEVIKTRNFCIDDFAEDGDVFPVIKVCSEEVKVYHEVLNIEKWPDSVGKCCPLNKIFQSNVSEVDVDPACIYLKDYDAEFSMKEALETINVSNLIFSNFPNCGKENNYHHYHFGTNETEYVVELNEDRTLSIREGCNRKRATIQKAAFCLDFMVLEDGISPVVIVCVPSGKNFHLERNPIIASFVAVSCAALLITLLTLTVTRVRRGMITVKKVNTLAGKTLISYVLSQLIGYFVLCVLTLADFDEGTHSCLVLSGFLLFFITAAFFWNTSICLECLLLTLQVRISGSKRFISYCLWSWGVPLILTTLVLTKDLQNNGDCGTITPKFGVERCFFSDPVAQILYFYLPISLTVVINAIFLMTAKILRKTKLKDLAKGTNRIGKRGTLKEAFSRSIKRRFGREMEQKQPHSGLRIHQHTNIWIESVKLVVWSGVTWVMELIGTLVSMYVGRPRGEWYHYLWYLPVACNCLRGIGIFVLIVITTDNKTRFVNTVRHVHSNFSTNVSKMISTVRFKEISSKKYGNGGTPWLYNGTRKDRKESVTTVTTTVSALQLQNDFRDPNKYCHSVSQYDRATSVPDQVDITDENQITVFFHNGSEPDAPIEDFLNFSTMHYCTHL